MSIQQISYGEEVLSEERLQKTGEFKSSLYNELMVQADRIKDFNFPLIFSGARGCGKRHLAKWIHANSNRQEKPFVLVNCGNVSARSSRPEEARVFYRVLQEKIREAEAGILFVENIEQLSSESRRLTLELLPALEEAGDVPAPRVIFSLIEPESGEGCFDFIQELRFRVNILQLRIPALNERAEDIPKLCENFLEEFRSSLGVDKGISSAALMRLKDQQWEGNIRELRNVLLEAAMQERNYMIEARNLSLVTAGKITSNKVDKMRQGKSFQDLMADYEKELLESALRECQGNQSMSSRLLKLNRSTMLKKMKLYELIEGPF